MTLNYADLADQLARFDATIGASELQGLLTGILVGPEKVDVSRWLSHVFDEYDLQDAAFKQLVAQILQFSDEIKADLHDEGIKFDLILADSQESLSERVQGLASWCQGFLLGLAESRLRDLKKLSAETQEWLSDMASFTQIGVDEDDINDEESEEAISELIEYIRIGVLTLHDEMHPPLPQGPIELQ